MNSKKSNIIFLPTSPTPLHRELADRITHLIHKEGLEPGARLNENKLAEELGVSRTPVRAALEYLAVQGYVERKLNKGMELVCQPPLPQPVAESPDAEDELLLRIARDRYKGRLADYVSEKELMASYGIGRAVLKQALDRLADLGVMERKLGYGWRFPGDVWDAAARHESYRFRMIIEPAAIREPGFALPPGWAKDMRERHEKSLCATWNEASSIAFFEMNAAFHEGLAAASGNRYFLTATQRQNRLRRLSNYDWKYGRERVEVNCREHLEMVARLEDDDTEMAALLMQRHLDLASRLRSTHDRQGAGDNEVA